MDMEELLGLDAGDFDNVDFTESDEEPEEAAANCGTAAPASGGGAEASGSTSVGYGVAPAAEGTSSSAVTTVVEPKEGTSFGTGPTAGSYSYSSERSSTTESKDAVADVERGTPLPEHACIAEENKATDAAAAAAAAAAINLPLLLRVERCCLESRPAEIEEAVAALSKRLGATPGETTGAGTANGGVSPNRKEEVAHVAAAAAAISPEAAGAALAACRAALRLCRGEYEEILRGTALFSAAASGQGSNGSSSSSSSSSLKARVRAFVVGGDDGGASGCGSSAAAAVGGGLSKPAAVWRAAEATWAGAAALGLFLQENYAGPELGADRTGALNVWFSEKLVGTYGRGSGGTGLVVEGDTAAQDLANIALACDGELPYPQSSLPGALVAARTVLAAVAGTTAAAAAAAVAATASPGDGGGRSRLATWSADGPLPVAAVPGASVGGGGGGGGGAASSTAQEGQEDAVFGDAVGRLSSAAWWSGRACVTHARLLISSSGRSETLWREALGLFGRAVRLFGGGVGAAGGEGGGRGAGVEREGVARRVAGLVWLEWGLAQHHFQGPTRGKESFARAKEASGLKAGLTGSLGKRTKYQQSQIAQLVLVASSSATPVMDAGAEADTVAAAKSGDAGGLPPVPPPGASGGRGSGETGLSAVISGDSSGGGGGGGKGGGGKGEVGDDVAEVAAVAGPELGMSTAVGEEGRRAAARQTVHAEDSALLEDISFVERDLENPGKLQDVDLAIILGLCLDVSNSNPRDGLTNEQMTPYIARVLRQPGCNWMIYSTALLQRAWVEFERSHARDRAALQLQALLDQHTTKLTYMQPTAATIEDSAPVQDRLRFLCCLSFPPRWELRRDLARRYAGMGVLGSAAAEFVDLEMWEEAVECYRQMQQVHKAEKIARERLQAKETPAMLAALGDLTQDPECWQRAWDLSGGRYAHAKASLARMLFSEAKYDEACGHYEQALAVKPLLTAAWFSLGVARMRLGRWQESLQAFSAVVQQEPEEGEAWGNMGAVHMHEGNWAGAAGAFTQGLKQMPSNWRMWENQAEALLRLRRWSSAAYACHRMLDLSDKSKRGVDAEFLALLVEGALKQEPLGSHTPSCMSAAGAAAATAAAATASSSSQEEGAASTPNGGAAKEDPGGSTGAGETQTRTRANGGGHGEKAGGGGTAAGAGAGAGAGGGSGDDLEGRPLCKQVAELLGRVVSATSTRGDARVWEVYARFNEGAGRDRSRVLDCVGKQCRALQRAGWEKDAAAVLRLAAASDKLVQLHLEDGKRQSAYQAKMHLSTLARKVKAADAAVGCPGHERIYALLHAVEGVLAELKSQEVAGLS